MDGTVICKSCALILIYSNLVYTYVLSKVIKSNTANTIWPRKRRVKIHTYSQVVMSTAREFTNRKIPQIIALQMHWMRGRWLAQKVVTGTDLQIIFWWEINLQPFIGDI